MNVLSTGNVPYKFGISSQQFKFNTSIPNITPFLSKDECEGADGTLPSASDPKYNIYSNANFKPDFSDPTTIANVNE
jgi:hypothetical protein